VSDVEDESGQLHLPRMPGRNIVTIVTAVTSNGK
jgi:hypothetical protein